MKSDKESCYTTLKRLGSIITFEKGCKKKCTESHGPDEKTECCRDNLCNRNKVPSTWPSPTSTTTVVTMTTTTTIAPSATPEKIITPAPDEFPLIPEDTTSVRRPGARYICDCNQCSNGNICEADIGCLTLDSGGSLLTSCVNDESTCNNKSNFAGVQFKCCHGNYCNRPPASTVPPTTVPPTGLPCDDEDTEQSGCGELPVPSTSA